MRRLTTLSCLAMLGLLTRCASPPPPAPAPPPPTPPIVSAPAPATADWRDLPLTPGTWTYAKGEATFAGIAIRGFPPFIMRCDLPRKVIIFVVVQAPGPSPATGMTITTTFGSKTVPAATAGGRHGEMTFEANGSDPFLDGLAYSRGRFLVMLQNGGQLILPAWPEIARVIEDCRR